MPSGRVRGVDLAYPPVEVIFPYPGESASVVIAIDVFAREVSWQGAH